MSSMADYVDEQLMKGYGPGQIRQFLISQGYNPADVDMAIAQAQLQLSAARNNQPYEMSRSVYHPGRSASAGQSGSLARPGIDPTGVSGISGASGAGASSSGISPSSINFSGISSSGSLSHGRATNIFQDHIWGPSEIFLKAHWRLALLFVPIILIGFVSIFIFRGLAGSGELSVSLELDDDLVDQGSKLEFSSEAVCQSDCILVYDIRKKTSPDVIRSLENDDEISGRQSFSEEMSLSGLIPGLYVLSATITSGELSKNAYASFEIIAVDDIKDPQIKDPSAQVPGKDDPVQDLPSPGRSNISSPKPASQASVEEIIASSRKDPAEAIGSCEGLVDQAMKDICFGGVARIVQKAEYCEKISATNAVDACYTNLALEAGDFSICGRISDPYQQQACEILKKEASR